MRSTPDMTEPAVDAAAVRLLLASQRRRFALVAALEHLRHARSPGAGTVEAIVAFRRLANANQVVLRYRQRHQQVGL